MTISCCFIASTCHVSSPQSSAPGRSTRGVSPGIPNNLGRLLLYVYPVAYLYCCIILIALTKPHDWIPCTINLPFSSYWTLGAAHSLRITTTTTTTCDQASTQLPTNADNVKKGVLRPPRTCTRPGGEHSRISAYAAGQDAGRV